MFAAPPCWTIRHAVMFVMGWLGILATKSDPSPMRAAEPPDQRAAAQLDPSYTREIRPLIVRYCQECHAGERVEAEIDLAAFATWADVRKQPQVWQKVADMLDSGQMPPPDAAQPAADERQKLQHWVQAHLTHEAAAQAGDPGPVVLRRLSNAEYSYTLRDLTGVPTLDPAREFPVDSASGEGFTNVGQSLVMSPALVTKYLDAAKAVAEHAVLLPDGIRFSPATTRRDWTNEFLARIRDVYSRYTDETGGMAVNLQGIQFDTNRGGRLPLEKYLAATLAEREALRSGGKTPAAVAHERGLSPKYLTTLWQVLAAPPAEPAAMPLDAVRARWRTAKPDDLPALMREILPWQQALWKFHAIGHLGRAGGPRAWMEPASPLAARQDLRFKLPAAAGEQDVVVFLAATDAGDGSDQDFVVWERPRLVIPGRPDVLLRDVRHLTRGLMARRERLLSSTARCLAAAAEASAATAAVDGNELARKYQVAREDLAAWLDYLGIGVRGVVKLGTPIERKLESASGYDFIKGWVGEDALSVVANASDQHVRIPGNMKPHSVAVHPTPTRSVAVGWRSPLAAMLRVDGVVQHAHPECGNGVAWTLELRRGNIRQRLAGGVSQGAKEIPVGPVPSLAVRPGDVVTLVIHPRDGNHSCDLTAIDLTLRSDSHEWNMARELSPDILAGNPHADSHGHAEVWHFFSEPAAGDTGLVLPAGSLLARWQSASSSDEQRKLADELQQLLGRNAAPQPADSPDAALYQQLTSLRGPLMTAALPSLVAQAAGPADANGPAYGLDPALFGKHPGGSPLDAASLCVRAPAVIEVRLPAGLAAGADLVTAGQLHPDTGRHGSVQLQVLAEKPAHLGLTAAAPIVATEGSDARRRLETALDEFRQLFPPALCYTKIVPVDEVVTLTLYHREDQHLVRLMLDDEQTGQLNRLWDEMLFVAREPLELVTAFEQISEFATQDRPDLVKSFAPLRQPILDRAAAFRQRLLDAEPAQLDAVLKLAEQAYRRPLTDQDSGQLRGLYARLRQDEISHDEAIRLTLARVLVGPAFLYRTEKPGPGATAVPVSDWELASRLSYFLWSSLPDDELRQRAAAGQLSDPSVLVAQTRRMLRDPRSRRLATEFACQWLHIYGFDQLDEKSETHFPNFAALRGAMYEESIQFFAQLFQQDASVLDLVDADYTFLNETLARHYEIPGVTGPEWRRVDGVRQFSRGGILTQAATLAKQSGASRTSPILRGNWLSEVVLGEKLPRPPKNVPVLSDTVPPGLTERQLIERHSSDAACAKCHARIDPFGFALEHFDAIGRFRDKDAGGLTIDARTTLPDGTKIDGLAGLQKYLLTARRDAFLRQFQRKLLGYALGRSVQLSDEPLLTQIQQSLAQHDYRVSVAVERIVTSDQFRKIRGGSKSG